MFCSLPGKKCVPLFVFKATGDANADAVAMNKEFIYSDGKAKIKHGKAL